MATSIKDVARRSGVSIATVSRVINSSAVVREDTRRRVMKTIRTLRFQPSIAARGLATGKTHLLALVTPPDPDFFGAYYFREIVRGIAASLGKHRYRLVIYQPPCAEPGADPFLAGMRADGLFLISPNLDDKLYRSLEAGKTPAVVISGRSDALDWTDLDNVGAAEQITRELIRLGHRRIAFIEGACHPDRNAQDRVRGYRKALALAGRKFDPALVVKGNHKVEGGRLAAQKLLALPERPTAIFAINDYTAIGVLQAARAAGLRVPEDLSLFGFDDMEMAGFMTPPLSTFRQPFFAMGEAACDILVARIARPGAAQAAREFKGALVNRASTAPWTWRRP